MPSHHRTWGRFTTTKWEKKEENEINFAKDMKIIYFDTGQKKILYSDWGKISR